MEFGSRRNESSIYIEAPNEERPIYPSLFLAGTISGAADWQKQMVDALADLKISIFNPRRPGEIMKDDFIARAQIVWEHQRLDSADMISFYFSPETVGPITLFELGRYSYGRYGRPDKPIFVGVHPDYSRKFDIEIQMKLVGIQPVYSLSDLITDVRSYIVNN